VTKLGECSQAVYRQRAAAIVNDVLAASGLLLVWFLDMMWGTYGSIYWRKLGAFRWLDHQGWGCELGAMWLDEIGRKSGWSFFGLLGMRMRGIMLESWCVMEGVIQASFYRPRERERRHEWAGMTSNEGVANWPLSWQFCPLLNGIWWGRNGQTLLDGLWPWNAELLWHITMLESAEIAVMKKRK
jgi:hypothetical protein